MSSGGGGVLKHANMPNFKKGANMFERVRECSRVCLCSMLARVRISKSLT